MPTYDYLCPNGHRFEVIHSVHGAGPDVCPICGASPVRKAFSAPTIHFKGTGWAKKDRSATARSGRSAASGAGDADSASTSGTSGGSETDSSAASDATSTPAKPTSDAKGSAGASSKAASGGSAAAD